MNIRLLTAIIICLIIVSASLVSCCRIEPFIGSQSDSGTKPFEVVMARYNEDIDWIHDIVPSNTPILVYNKGNDLPLTNKYRVKKLPNVGRCDHTFLHHIVTNYNSLADVTIFLPASSMDDHKKEKTLRVVNKAFETSNTVIDGVRLDDVQKDYYGFTLSEWAATNPKNSALHPSAKLLPCPIRPFGAWYEKHFPGVHTTIFVYYGILAVHKSHVHQHPVSNYEELLKYLDHHSNPEAGHYIERSWQAIFNPVPEECLYAD